MPQLNIDGHVVLFDEQDAGLIAARRWYVRVRIDAKRSPRLYVLSHRLALMHRLILGAARGEVVDHINGNPLDNRRANLRLADASINAQNQRVAHRNNKTGFLGVDFVPNKCPRRPFRAQIKIAGKKRHIGQYETAEAAHAAYVTAKRALHEGCTL